MLLGGRRPDNLGVVNGRLALCPNKPNCVSTQATDPTQTIQPLSYTVEKERLVDAIDRALKEEPRTKVIVQTSDYVHAECTSLLFRFVDDLEIWIDEQAKELHARSASRIGYSDLGVNRKRVERLFAKVSQALND